MARPRFGAAVSGEDAPAIRIEGLVKEFAAPRGVKGAAPVRAVDDLSLEIPRGSFYGLLGPNGAGKTTTIRVLTGLGLRDQGRVEVAGMDVRDEFRRVRRLVGLAPQEFDFDQFLTTRQVLMYRGMYFEMSRGAARRRASDMLERFGLTHKADVRVHHLSGGQKRRVLIAKSLMHDPEILILDEPTAGIDVSLRHQLWEYLRELNREGKTILLTTHYIEEAEALCDRVGVIDAGRLVAEGSPAELADRSGSDLVHVHLAAPYKRDVAKLVTRTGWDAELLTEGRVIAVRGGRGGEMASRLLERLVKDKVRVENVEIRRQRLEDAFVQITGRRIDASGGAAPVADPRRRDA